jgi:hypothetical protein
MGTCAPDNVSVDITGEVEAALAPQEILLHRL